MITPAADAGRGDVGSVPGTVLPPVPGTANRQHDPVSDAILPVGRDCDCGFPMIWRGSAQVCAVYGLHSAPEANPIHFRDYSAPGARLVQLCLEAPNTTRNATRLRALRAVS